MIATRVSNGTSLFSSVLLIGAAGCTVINSNTGDGGSGNAQDAAMSGPDATGFAADGGSSAETATAADGANMQEAGTTGDAVGPTSGLAYKPSNVPSPSFQNVDAVTISASDCVIETDMLTVSCVHPTADGGLPYSFVTVQQSDGSQVAQLSLRSLLVQQAARVTVTGTIPLVVLAQTTVNIQGTVTTAPPGNAGGPSVTQSGAGGGPGGGLGGNSSGAGGGGYCGTGGQGSSQIGDAGVPTPGGRSYGTPTLSPLVAGSAGGNEGTQPDGGDGGGAIQISAGMSILVGTAGAINVPGNGGGNGNGGGGGSGGALLLEAPSVSINGILAANGAGAGVQMPNQSGGGQSGQPSLQPATAGGPQAGTGGAGTLINGGNGSAGSGGGAVGRIRINTTSGAATVGSSAIVSPTLMTSCATQGTLGL